MIIDLLDIDGDRREIRRVRHRFLENAGAAAGRERDVALAQNGERDPGQVTQSNQRRAAMLQAEQNAMISIPHRRRHTGHPWLALGCTLRPAAAADLGEGGYSGAAGQRVYEQALRRGAYLRPLGDTVYVAPPLNVAEDELETLLAILEESIRAREG